MESRYLSQLAIVFLFGGPSNHDVIHHCIPCGSCCDFYVFSPSHLCLEQPSTPGPTQRHFLLVRFDYTSLNSAPFVFHATQTCTQHIVNNVKSQLLLHLVWFCFAWLNKVTLFKHVHGVVSLCSVETFWARPSLRSFQMLDICFAGGHLHIFYRHFLFFVDVRFFVPFGFMAAQLCLSSAAPLSVHVWGLRYAQTSIFTQLVFQVAEFTGLDQCRQLCIILTELSSLSRITGKKPFPSYIFVLGRKYSNVITMASSLSSLSLTREAGEWTLSTFCHLCPLHWPQGRCWTSAWTASSFQQDCIKPQWWCWSELSKALLCLIQVTVPTAISSLNYITASNVYQI